MIGNQTNFKRIIFYLPKLRRRVDPFEQDQGRQSVRARLSMKLLSRRLHIQPHVPLPPLLSPRTKWSSQYCSAPFPSKPFKVDGKERFPVLCCRILFSVTGICWNKFLLLEQTSRGHHTSDSGHSSRCLSRFTPDVIWGAEWPVRCPDFLSGLRLSGALSRCGIFSLYTSLKSPSHPSLHPSPDVSSRARGTHIVVSFGCNHKQCLVVDVYHPFTTRIRPYV